MSFLIEMEGSFNMQRGCHLAWITPFVDVSSSTTRPFLSIADRGLVTHG